MSWVLPNATFRPVVNRSGGNRNPTLGLVLHVTADDYGSPFNYFNRATSQASSTWFTGNGKGGTVDGDIEQYVDPDTEHAWAQGAGNRDYHSVECEGTPDEPMTDKQLRAVGHIFAEGHKRYGWPLQLANTPGEPGLGVHNMGGAAWGGHSCPGPGPREGQRGQILAYAEAELNPTATPATPTPAPAPGPAPAREPETQRPHGSVYLNRLQVGQADSDSVRRYQQALRDYPNISTIPLNPSGATGSYGGETVAMTTLVYRTFDRWQPGAGWADGDLSTPGPRLLAKLGLSVL